MFLYNEDGAKANADSEQAELMMENGWSLDKPKKKKDAPSKKTEKKKKKKLLPTSKE